MSDPFLAEIRPFAFNFVPTGWGLCDGHPIPISQNTALFALLGTFYGGDGKSFFNLPNLQGAAPMHQGQGSGQSERYLGEVGGAPFIGLLDSEMPAHNHTFVASRQPATGRDPTNQLYAQASAINIYNDNAEPTTTLAFQASTITGSSQPHNNLQPYTVVNYCIALRGIFPQRP